MIVVIVPALCALIGLIMYLGANPPSKWQEVGKIMLFCGLLVTLIVVARITLSFLK